MNWLDLVFLGVVAISVIISLVRGFVREVISVVVWIGATWIAVSYSASLAAQIEPWIDSPTVRLIAAFAALFIVTLLVGAIINYAFTLLVKKTGLTGTDRALGVVFGGLRGALIIALIVLAAGLTSITAESWWRQSALAGWFTPWVCRVGVAGWLDGVRINQPVLLGESEAEAAEAATYWQDMCRGQTP